MDKITQALKKILPAEQIVEVTKAVENAIAEHKQAVQNQFQEKLDQAYEQLSEERKNDEVVAEEGYQQAYEIITSLMGKLDEQKEEFETALEEGFEEAYSELQKEKSKNQNLEVEIYEEADKKLQEMKNLMVDKLDQFLSLQESEIYESAKRDVLNDPNILEQRVAIEKMADVISDYIGSDRVSSSKLEEKNNSIESLKGQLRIVETKNFRLTSQNNKLEEQVKEANSILTESVKNERTNRAKNKSNASGRGQRVVNEQITPEYVNTTSKKSNNDQDLNEGDESLDELLVLSGIIDSE